MMVTLAKGFSVRAVEYLKHADRASGKARVRFIELAIYCLESALCLVLRANVESTEQFRDEPARPLAQKRTTH